MNVKMMEPDYYKDFRCIGDLCRNNCCSADWDIHVDKKTYKKYKNLPKNHPMYKTILKNIVLLEGNNDFRYAKYRQTENKSDSNKRCVFQDEQGLCVIHANLGEEYLSNTCKHYPRSLNYCIRKEEELSFFESACNISCEEVANLFLKKEDYIEYELSEENYGKNYVEEHLKSRVTNFLREEERSIIGLYPNIKSIIIAILQDRNYNFEDRLVLLAIFCQKLNDLEKNFNEETVLNYINEFVYSVENGLFNSILQNDIKNEISYAFSAIIINIILKINDCDNEILNRVINNISKLQDAELKEYSEGDFAKNSKKVLKEKAIFLEHIFVNEASIRMMPFYKKYDIFENAQLLVVIYSVYRLMLSLYIGDQTEISDEKLVDLTAYFGKILLHTNMTNEIIIDTLKTINLDNLSSLIVLIKG